MIIQLRSTTRPTSAFNFDHPAVFFDSSDLSFQLRSSSCILRLVRSQLSTSIILLYSSTRPISAFNFDHPAVFFDSSDLSFQLRSSSCILRLARSQAAFCDSTDASYPRLTSSCAHLRPNYTSYQRYHSIFDHHGLNTRL